VLARRIVPGAGELKMRSRDRQNIQTMRRIAAKLQGLADDAVLREVSREANGRELERIASIVRYFQHYRPDLASRGGRSW